MKGKRRGEDGSGRRKEGRMEGLGEAERNSREREREREKAGAGGIVFVLFMVSFAIPKFLSLIRSHLFLFFSPLVYELDPKGLLPFM